MIVLDIFSGITPILIVEPWLSKFLLLKFAGNFDWISSASGYWLTSLKSLSGNFFSVYSIWVIGLFARGRPDLDFGKFFLGVLEMNIPLN
jgi:hypothetical protein